MNRAIASLIRSAAKRLRGFDGHELAQRNAWTALTAIAVERRGRADITTISPAARKGAL